MVLMARWTTVRSKPRSFAIWFGLRRDAAAQRGHYEAAGFASIGFLFELLADGIIGGGEMHQDGILHDFRRDQFFL